MRVFILSLLGVILPTIIIGGKLVDLGGDQPTRRYHFSSFNIDRRPTENFDDVVLKAHSLGSSEVRKAPVKTYTPKSSMEGYDYPSSQRQPVLTGVVGQAPQQINLLQNPFGQLFPAQHPNLLGSPHHLMVHPMMGAPILRPDQLPNNQVPPGYVFIPGTPPPNGILPMHPLMMAAPSLHPPVLTHQEPSITPGQLVTVAPSLLTGNNHFTPIPGFPTFAPFTMPPAFDKLVPEAIEAKEKTQRKYSPSKHYKTNMNIDTLESRLPKYKKRSSNRRYKEASYEKSEIWMVPYYSKD
uniref:Secreted protein n=1 Tax=Parastrongyloides trichosuri TaxID=131310 RepID=A0A0N5A742_PARTI